MANCQSCHADILAGTRWCSICHSNVINPSFGRLAPPVKRLGAYALDLALPAIALYLILNISMVGGGIAAAGTSDDAGIGFGILLGVGMLVAYAVWAFRLFARGTTPGKKLLGMRVIKEDGTSAGFSSMLVREWVGKPISAMVLSLGFLWILFDRDNQGWHDKLVSTYVVG